MFGLNSWIIQDGNYGDFFCGQVAEFAVELTPAEMGRSQLGDKWTHYIGDWRNEIAGQLIHVDRTDPEDPAWVFDLGIYAYATFGVPKDLQVGYWVTGTAYLGVDPYFYFEALAENPGMPPLIYSWRIERILLDKTPRLETKDEEGRTVLIRDESQRTIVPIERTDARNDDGGLAEYLLECTLLDKPPKTRSTTAIY